MADEAQYEGLDEATLNDMLAKATNYDERSAIRKAIRKLKGGGNKAKKTGSASYRRAGYQAPKSMVIPNSVTGNVLPNRVNMENIHKTEVPQEKATISYLKAKTVTTRAGVPIGSAGGASGRSSSPRGSTTSPRGSASSVTPEPKVSEAPREETSEEDSKVRSSNVTEAHTPSPQPPAPRTIVDEKPREPSPEPREPTPEPPREPTPEPEPPREPTPEPEPPREPTPEPEPPREPTPEPEPPREPTPEPEPPREPTPEPEPPREPTPEPEPPKEPSPEPLEETDHVKVEEEEEEDDEEDDDEEDEGDEDEEDSEEEDEERAQRIQSYDKDDERVQYRQTKQVGDGPKGTSGLPQDVLSRREEGIEGDFRKKLQKTAETKIDTRAAFPQAKTKGEQVDFRNVLKKSKGPERKTFRTGGHAQLDFRGNLKKATPEKAPKPSRKPRDRDDEEEDDEFHEQQEPQEEEQQPEPQDQHDEDIEPEDQPEEPEEEEEVPKEEEEVVHEEEVEVEKEDVEEAAPDETDSKSPVSTQDEDSYEARQAERRRRREQRQKELEEMSTSSKPVQNGTKEESREKKEESPSDPDSYEARREARRKAREERLKAASARVDEKPRLTYRERKALEAKKQMANAKQSREKWENREEETGAKDEAKPASFKKKDTATQQLLHWCQHKTKYYENVNIKDFRQSWSDGLAFCAILHSFMPDKIPYDDLTPDNPRKNFTVAFDAAADAGIPQMLDVDDMVSVKIPDAKSIMTFLVTIYQHFNS